MADFAPAGGASDGPEPLGRHSEVELRSSGGASLPDFEAAFPAVGTRPPPPRGPPPAGVLRPPEYAQQYGSCFLACAGVGDASSRECLGCGAVCGSSLFGGHARCGDCGATFCGDCRGAGLRRGEPGLIVCDDSRWRCVDGDACENQPHSLRIVKSYWGPDAADDAAAPRASASDAPVGETVTL